MNLDEGNLRITYPDSVVVEKFDDATEHGLLDCMKAVDFIFELDDRYLFIEFKDPQHPQASADKRARFIEELKSGKIDETLKYKFRDSFLYRWASGKTNKPIYYLVLIALDTLSSAELITRTDDLRRKLPLKGPKSGIWSKSFVSGCAVFNIEAWNKSLTSFQVVRI